MYRVYVRRSLGRSRRQYQKLASVFILGLLCTAGFFNAAYANTLPNGGSLNADLTLGDIDVYTFDATSGDEVSIQVVDTGDGQNTDITPQLYLSNPDGTTRTSGWDISVASLIDVALVQSGTYTLQVSQRSNYSGGVGPYTVHFAKVPGANEGGTLPNGGSIDGDLTLGDIDTYTFVANAGDEVSIQVADMGDGQNTDLTPQIYLSNPDGSTRTSDWDTSVASMIDVSLVQSGTYTLQISQRSNYTGGVGPYTVHFAKVPGANEGGALPVSGSVDGDLTLGDIDTYTFFADAGDEVSIQVADTGDGQNTDLTPQIYLSNPDGSTRTSDWDASVAGVVDVSLFQSGLYTLQISQRSNYSGGVGPYTININCTGSCGTQPPVVPVLIGPADTIQESTPAYQWYAVSNSSWYRLEVFAGGQVHQQWYTAAEVGCGSGFGTCQITPNVTISGAATWRVRGWNTYGNGAWASWRAFNVPANTPGKATLISPSGAGVADPVYSWSAVEGATWYYLWVSDSAGAEIRKWYKASQAGCADTSTCSVTAPGTVSGNVRWWVRTWNTAGNGPWSESLAFAVGGGVPGKPTVYTPSGSGNGSLPSYSWSAVSGATWYYLWVNDATGSPVKKWYEVGGSFLNCTATVCNVMPTTPITGSATWWVKGWNSHGNGPWSNGMSFSP